MTAPATLGERLGWAAIYILCLSAFLAPAGVAGSLALLLLGFILVAPGRPDLLRDPIVLASLAFALFLVAQTAAYTLQSPEQAPELWDAASAWLQLFLFIPFGMLLASRPARTGHLLILVLAGLTAGMLIRTDWPLLLDSPGQFLESRPGFGFPAIAFALYSGAGILGLLFVGRRFWTERASPAAMLGLGALWLATLALLGQGFLATQSRGAWLAFVVALIAGGLLARRHERARPSPPRKTRSRWIALVGIGAVAMLIALNAGLMTKRLTFELEAARSILNDGAQTGELTSLGLRWNAQVFGLRHWLERPWLGWGAGSSHRLMSESQDARLEEQGETLKHLHNSYLEILFQFGALGGLLLLLPAVLLILRLSRDLRARSRSTDYGTLLLILIVFTCVWSLWNYRAVHQDWRAYWTILAGAAFGLTFRKGPGTPARSEPSPQE